MGSAGPKVMRRICLSVVWPRTAGMSSGGGRRGAAPKVAVAAVEPHKGKSDKCVKHTDEINAAPAKIYFNFFGNSDRDCR